MVVFLSDFLGLKKLKRKYDLVIRGERSTEVGKYKVMHERYRGSTSTIPPQNKQQSTNATKQKLLVAVF